MYEMLIRQLDEFFNQNDLIDEKTKKAFAEQVDLLQSQKIGLLDFCSNCVDCIDSIRDIQGFCFDEDEIAWHQIAEGLKNIFINWVPTGFYKAQMARLLRDEEKELLTRTPMAFGLAYKNMIRKINFSDRSNSEKRDLSMKLTKIAKEYYEKTKDVYVRLIDDVKSNGNLAFGDSLFEDLQSSVLAVSKFLKTQPANPTAVSLWNSLGETWELAKSKELSTRRIGMIFKKWAVEASKSAEKVADLQSVLEELQFKINIVMLLDQFTSNGSPLLADIKAAFLGKEKNLEVGFEGFCRLVPKSSTEAVLLSKIKEASWNYFNVFELPRAPSPDIDESVANENRQPEAQTQFFITAEAPPKIVRNFDQSRGYMKFV